MIEEAPNGRIPGNSGNSEFRIPRIPSMAFDTCGNDE